MEIDVTNWPIIPKMWAAIKFIFDRDNWGGNVHPQVVTHPRRRKR